MQTLLFVSHTHWDREWYEPFQVFRTRLVHCIDILLDLLAADPEYEYFLLDGQTIVLEDYLEVRPDRAQTFRDLIGSGRIQVGPWYVLPDEFLVSGESLVRNLLHGMRLARSFGEPMQIGYLPDPFGHVSQMPQILNGFGLNSAAFRRGLADEPTELWWEGADRTRILACYLRDSYDNAAWLPHDQSGFVDGVVKLRDSLAPYAVTSNFLMLNGTDHMEPWRDLPSLLEAARERIPGVKIIHASLPLYVERVRAEIAERGLTLNVVRGELRNPKRHHLLPGVASTRVWIKQRNACVQNLMEKWAEPFAAIAIFETGEGKRDVQQSPASIKGLLRVAWKYLLQNHPHDSICGCGIDQTHADMIPRFDWAEQTASQIVQSSLASLAAAVDTHVVARGSPIVVFNPASGPRTDLVRLTVERPTRSEHLTVCDATGETVPFHVPGYQLDGKHSDSDRQTQIEFIASKVPGHGYRTFYLSDNERPVPSVSPSSSPTVLENGFFRIKADADDGTLTLIDKSTSLVLTGLNRFVDGGDRGDLYNYCPPEMDSITFRPSARPRISTEKTPARQTLRVEMNYRLPAGIAEDRSRRSEEYVDEPIVTTVSLYPGVRRIDFQTTVVNQACDHRLRVEFPTPIVAPYANSDQPFDVVSRPLELPKDTHDWIEQPRPEAPMQSFVSVSDGKTGLTLATRGLVEYEARRDPTGTTLALTLLRCTGWLSRGDLSTRVGEAGPSLMTPGAQEIGTHVFEYALIPDAGDWRAALAEASSFVTPMRALVTDLHAGTLPLGASFFDASPREFVITCIKPAEENDALIVRGFNMGDQPINAHIALWREFARASRVNLGEDEIAPIVLHDGRRVELQVREKEIVTIEFWD